MTSRILSPTTVRATCLLLLLVAVRGGRSEAKKPRYDSYSKAKELSCGAKFTAPMEGLTKDKKFPCKFTKSILGNWEKQGLKFGWYKMVKGSPTKNQIMRIYTKYNDYPTAAAFVLVLARPKGGSESSSCNWAVWQRSKHNQPLQFHGDGKSTIYIGVAGPGVDGDFVQGEVKCLASDIPGQPNIFDCAGACAAAEEDRCMKALGGTNVTVILVADPGEFSGLPERMHYIANLKGAVEYNGTETMCLTKTLGTLMGEPTAVAATGIGPTAAAICTTEILLCAKYVKEILYVGTSGWSPQPGGVLNAKDGKCSGANPSTSVCRVGDVCVSPFSVNWVCKKADYESQCNPQHDFCYLPGEISGPNATYLYGNCEFYSTANGITTLADELMAAGKKVMDTEAFPIRNAAVKSWETTYWTAMSNGTGVDYEYEAAGQPVVWDYTQCMEVDGQFFYSGVPWEMTARDYAAMTLNTAGVVDAVKAKEDMIAVAAMEAVGMSEAMERWAKTSGHSPIPYVNVRGMSNQLHHPVAMNDDGTWKYGAKVPEDFVNGYSYAIATSSTVVLTMFQTRCEAKNGAGAEICKFTIEYK